LKDNVEHGYSTACTTLVKIGSQAYGNYNSVTCRQPKVSVHDEIVAAFERSVPKVPPITGSVTHRGTLMASR
jgi:hypothetical protein